MGDRYETRTGRLERDRAIGLIQIGLTPSRVEQSIRDETTMNHLASETNVDVEEVRWLAERWPLWVRRSS